MVSAEEQFAVIATPGPVPAVVDRARWPSHVTIAGNFQISPSGAETIPALLDSIGDSTARFSANLGPLDYFGPCEDVPVLLASHPAFFRLHNLLARELAPLPGFAPAEPNYWGDGYRPHVTLGAAVSAKAGEILSMTTLTLVSLLGHNGHRRSAVNLR